MKPSLIADAHVYVAIFRCERCNQPITSHVISAGPYPESEIRDHPFLVACECGWSVPLMRGSEAIKLFPIDWEFPIYRDPETWDIEPLPESNA